MDSEWFVETYDYDSDGSKDSVQVISEAKWKQANKSQKRTKSAKNNPKKTKKNSAGKMKTSLSTLETPENRNYLSSEVVKEEEDARKRRVAEKQALLNSLFGDATLMKKLVLDFDPETNQELVTVDPKLVEKLKRHQIAGVTFMWNACFESLKQIETGKGGGCILAHCMGLGKTLQVITLVHTLFNHPATKVNNVLILCPVNTLLNWKAEFQKWLPDLTGHKIHVYDVTKFSDNLARAKQLEMWTKSGGVMIFGYEMFRALINNENIATEVRAQIIRALLNPGPDLVVCDEGHVLKNEKSAISKTMSLLKSSRRIILTGTPLQNNLLEYYSMIQFVKPMLLGTKNEFQNRFAHPISKGQFQNSEVEDVNVMKERSFVLHRLLDGIVQRYDSNELKPYLPPKHEFVILVALSDLQAKLYGNYIRNHSQMSLKTIRESGTRLLNDYKNMRMIWTHPMAMKFSDVNERATITMDGSDGDHSEFEELNNNSSKRNSAKKSMSARRITQRQPLHPVNVIDLGDSDSDCEIVSEGVNNPMTNESDVRKPWWKDLISSEDFDDYSKGPKVLLLFSILKECRRAGEKLLIFSQSLPSLDMIEYFLTKEDRRCYDPDSSGTWEKDSDYFRLDGSTAKEKRADDCRIFNDPENTRARLFLISTKAGGLGINLTVANRVIIFDVSWNPSNDIQSIFRVFRFGQTKPCYIYRFVSQGTMEERMYERQVTKISVARRVIDEEQIDRHFTKEEVADLYAFDRVFHPPNQVPEFPNDHLLAGLLKKYPGVILSYLKHDSLLENTEEEELTEAERLEAWRVYEYEVANSAEDAVTSEQIIRSSLKELNPKLTKPKLEKELTMVRDRLLKFIAKEQKKNSPNSNTTVDSPANLNSSSFSRYGGSTKTHQRPQFGMTVSRTTQGVTLENGISAVAISEDPELAIKQLALLHYLQHKYPEDDPVWRPMETPSTWKLWWNQSPKALIALFQAEFDHWKKKLSPKFTVVGSVVLLHLRFCCRKVTLLDRLERHHVEVEWVANDLEAAEELLKTRFPSVRASIVPPNVTCKTSVEPEGKDTPHNTPDCANVSTGSKAMDEVIDVSDRETIELSDGECTSGRYVETVEIDPMYEEMYGDLIAEEEIYEDDCIEDQ